VLLDRSGVEQETEARQPHTMASNLSGKVALVTGGSAGIGLGIG
jgi:short-subunit dehydrogenase involved in D-alanine esterification of teichoic acids